MPPARWPHPPPTGRRGAPAPLGWGVALLLLLAAALAALPVPAARGAQADGVRVQLLAINDFHGALETVPRPGDGRPIGGAAVLAAYLDARGAAAAARGGTSP